MKQYTDSDIWKHGIKLVQEIYKITNNFPPDERFAMTQQLRRASTSILANFAEGYSRYSPKDKSHKYTIARGECSEVNAFLLISEVLGYSGKMEIECAINLSNTIGKMLTGLIKSQSMKRETVALQSNSLSPHPLIS